VIGAFSVLPLTCLYITGVWMSVSTDEW